MFLLHWEVYVLMELIVNLQNEDLHWFSGRSTFIDGRVYIRFSGGVDSSLPSSVFNFLWFFSRVLNFVVDTKWFFLY